MLLRVNLTFNLNVPQCQWPSLNISLVSHIIEVKWVVVDISCYSNAMLCYKSGNIQM